MLAMVLLHYDWNWSAAEREFDSLRTDSRFADVMRRVGH